MQPYEHSRAPYPYRDHHGHPPAVRPGHEPLAPGSGTPIYDALYAEYRSLFRTLPGDRTGEEELRFEGFGTVRGTGTGHWDGPGRQSDGWQHELRQRGHRMPAALPPAPRDGRTYDAL